MPSPNVNSTLINPDPQVIQYNIHDPPHRTNNMEEDEEEMKNSQLQTMMMMTQNMKTKIIHHRTKVKIHYQFSPVE
eukprot:13778218-Ditylum_brightwellii.AAC.1